MLELLAKAGNPAGWHMFTAAQNSQNEIGIILKEAADFILSVLLTYCTNRCNIYFQALTFVKKFSFSKLLLFFPSKKPSLNSQISLRNKKFNFSFSLEHALKMPSGVQSQAWHLIQ